MPAPTNTLEKTLITLSDPRYLQTFLSWFKTEPGNYAAHDKFIGVPMPVLRSLAKQNRSNSFGQIEQCIYSPFNEARMLGWLMVCYKCEQREVRIESGYQFCKKHIDQLNNWNLVDTIIPVLIGRHYESDKSVEAWLLQLSKSRSLWHRRSALLATLREVRQARVFFALKICTILVEDREDLINKACGWILREIGKQKKERLESFLLENIRKIPLVTLRYAIEHSHSQARKKWLDQRRHANTKKIFFI